MAGTVRGPLAGLVAMVATAAGLTPGRAAPSLSPSLPGIGAGGGDRHVIDVDQAPWRILGRVQTGLGGRCTGFAVAPTVVETAAHCVWIPRTGHYFQPWDVHVLMGYRMGQYRIHATARSIVITEGYDPRREADTARNDRALLVLDRAVATRAELLPTARPGVGAPAILVGYQQDRGEIAIGDLRCRILGRLPEGERRDPPGTIRHDCAGTYGDSGAPLLVSTGTGTWGIAGVAVIALAGRGGVAAPMPP